MWCTQLLRTSILDRREGRRGHSCHRGHRAEGGPAPHSPPPRAPRRAAQDAEAKPAPAPHRRDDRAVGEARLPRCADHRAVRLRGRLAGDLLRAVPLKGRLLPRGVWELRGAAVRAHTDDRHRRRRVVAGRAGGTGRATGGPGERPRRGAAHVHRGAGRRARDPGRARVRAHAVRERSRAGYGAHPQRGGHARRPRDGRDRGPARHHLALPAHPFG